jgi:hypothetical protein
VIHENRGKRIKVIQVSNHDIIPRPKAEAKTSTVQKRVINTPVDITIADTFLKKISRLMSFRIKNQIFLKPKSKSTIVI